MSYACPTPQYGMEFRAVMAVERLSRPRGNDRVILRITPRQRPIRFPITPEPRLWGAMLLLMRNPVVGS